MMYKNKNLSGLRLAHASTEKMEFYGCVFTDCVFDDYQIRDCEFEKCSFKDCVIKNLKQSFLRINDCSFIQCLVQGVNLAGLSFPHSLSLLECKLVYVDFTDLRLQKSDFTSNAFKECIFEECDMIGSDFSGSEFTSTEFRRSELSGCDFSHTQGLDLNHQINGVFNVKIPEEAGIRILKRMGITIT